MENYILPLQIRWSDLDPNFHLRHSVYYDWAAYCRISFLNQLGLTAAAMQQLNFGPILFREECIFKKEIKLEDQVAIGLKLLKSKRDYSRWSIQHEIVKNNDTLAAIVTVDGAWLNVIQRKLATPPLQVQDIFSKMPVSESFQWND